jgi:hypothetical protein
LPPYFPSFAVYGVLLACTFCQSKLFYFAQFHFIQFFFFRFILIASFFQFLFLSLIQSVLKSKYVLIYWVLVRFSISLFPCTVCILLLIIFILLLSRFILSLYGAYIFQLELNLFPVKSIVTYTIYS